MIYKAKRICLWVHLFYFFYLHPDDSIDEENHGNEQSDIGQSLREEEE